MKIHKVRNWDMNYVFLFFKSNKQIVFVLNRYIFSILYIGLLKNDLETAPELVEYKKFLFHFITVIFTSKLPSNCQKYIVYNRLGNPAQVS